MSQMKYRTLVFDKDGGYVEEGIHEVNMDFVQSQPIGSYVVIQWSSYWGIYKNGGRDGKSFYVDADGYPKSIDSYLALLGINLK